MVVVGLPGSGKSSLLRPPDDSEFVYFNADEGRAIARAE
jgi:hypothetical protein